MTSTPVDTSEGYTFEERSEGSKDDELSYLSLYHGILSGLYYLPPERILKCQSGWGWPIHYKSIREVNTSWHDIDISFCHHISAHPLLNSFSCLQYSNVRRIVDEQLGIFRIYRLKVTNAHRDEWGHNLVKMSTQDSKLSSNNIL